MYNNTSGSKSTKLNKHNRRACMFMTTECTIHHSYVLHGGQITPTTIHPVIRTIYGLWAAQEQAVLKRLEQKTGFVPIVFQM